MIRSCAVVISSCKSQERRGSLGSEIFLSGKVGSIISELEANALLYIRSPAYDGMDVIEVHFWTQGFSE